MFQGLVYQPCESAPNPKENSRERQSRFCCLGCVYSLWRPRLWPIQVGQTAAADTMITETRAAWEAITITAEAIRPIFTPAAIAPTVMFFPHASRSRQRRPPQNMRGAIMVWPERSSGMGRQQLRLFHITIARVRPLALP